VSTGARITVVGALEHSKWGGPISNNKWRWRFFVHISYKVKGMVKLPL
jgi:hypothetical protein